MSRSTSFSTAAVQLSARAQTVIGPPGDLCSGDGTFNNLSTTCSCPQVKPQQRKCPGYCRKQLSAPVDWLHGVTILHQMPGRRKCFQRSRYTLSAPLPQIPTGMHHLVCYHPPFSLFPPNSNEPVTVVLGLESLHRRTASIWRFGLMFASLVAASETWELSVGMGLSEIKQICQRSKGRSSRKVPKLSDRLLRKSKQGLVFGLMMPWSAGNEKCCLTGTQTNDICLSGNTSMLRFYYCFFVWQFQNHKDARCGFYSANCRLIFYFCFENE